MSWIWVIEKVRAMIESKKSESLKTMFPEDLEEYMKSHEEGSYTLLDVRQPSEYEEAHLPGARLVPLPRLMDALGELDRRRPTFVYCAVGGRSRTAAQFLLNQGFEDVHNLQGGIQAWEQPTAFGPSELHLRFVRGDESPREVVAVAYEMEEGLRQFHQRMKDSASDPGLAELLTHLVRAEESHKQTLKGLFEEMTGEPFSLADADFDSSVAKSSQVMEGGLDIETFMQQNRSYLQTVAGYLDIAMMIEIQALDLYVRMANESRNEQAQQVLRKIAQEEKAHLALLGRYMDEKTRTSLDRTAQ